MLVATPVFLFSCDALTRLPLACKHVFDSPSSQIQELLFQSLMEMELIHRQEELEHAELERALQMSLMVEEERLHDLMSSGQDDDARAGAGAGAKTQQDNKVCIHAVVQ
jgi:hypothetical protein